LGNDDDASRSEDLDLISSTGNSLDFIKAEFKIVSQNSDF